MLSDPVFYIRGSLFARLGGSRFPQGLQRWNPFEMKYTRASRVSQNETFHSIFVPDATRVTRGHVCIFQHGISTAAVCQSWYNVSDLCGHHRVQTLASRSWSWIVIVLPDRSSAAVSILIIRDFPIRWFRACIVSRRITRRCLEQQTEKRNRNGYSTKTYKIWKRFNLFTVTFSYFPFPLNSRHKHRKRVRHFFETWCGWVNVS